MTVTVPEKRAQEDQPEETSGERKRAKTYKHLHATCEEVTDDDAPKKPAVKRKKSTDNPKKEKPEAAQQRAETSDGSPEGKSATGETAESELKANTKEEPQDVPMKGADDSKESTEDAKQDPSTDTPVLESGTIYFFIRGRVNIESPENLSEVKRAHIVLHPSGSKHYRLLAVPKKKLPKATHDRFLTIVEEPKLTAEQLKETFLKGRTYQTKTQGERTDYPAEVVGEGVYVLTKAEKEGGAHLAYSLNVPEEIGEVQKEMGIKKKGSWVVRVKNPNAPGPANGQVDDKPEYPKEIMDGFQGLRWGSVTPEHLDYKNCEVLFIGEKSVPEEGEHAKTEEKLEEMMDETEDTFEELKDTDVIFQKLDELRGQFDDLKTSWD